MLPVSIPTSPETLAYLSHLAEDEEEYQAAILQARRYDAGQQFVALTNRLRQFLGGDTSDTSADYKRLRLNVCRIVLAAVVDRLTVTGFDSDEQPQEAPAVDERGQPTTRLIKPVAAWAWQLWQQNRMDAKQRRVHETCLRDGESFVLVDWDNTTGRARFTPHQRFVDGSLDGDNDGCRAFYRNDDSDQDLLFVTKRWVEVFYDQAGRRITRQRLTIYHPDRIEKYSGFPGSWQRVTDDPGEPWPIPWRDTRGRSLGIPVAHFRSSAGMEAREAWPMQNLINKVLVDLAAESDIAAFRILVAFGWKPVDSAGNPLSIEPGRWLGSEKPGASMEVVQGVDLTQFVNVIESLMLWTAMATDTPISKFITTKQVSSEGTQKEQNEALLTKTGQRQGEQGNGWEDCMSIARRLENTFGRGGLDEGAQLYTGWKSLIARDETAELERAKLRKELGMPIRIIGKELGMTEEEIMTWEQDANARAEQAQAQFQPGEENAQ
jgi:hypothetical protein